jgi:hypothetical protein
MTELTDKVAAWLSKSGFPLEMRVAAQWEGAGFEVSQGAYYIDSESNVARETDIVASMTNVDSEAWARWITVVECKSDRSAPWVLFGGRGRPLDAKARLRAMGATRQTQSYLVRVSRRDDVANLAAFRSDRPAAYGMIQALREGHTDHAYAAVMSVAKAASYFLHEFSKDSVGDETLEMVWPVIITEAPLLEARLSPSNEIEVDEIDQGTLVWRHPTAGKGIAMIDIVRAQIAPQYIKSIKSAAELLLFETQSEIAQVVELRERQRAARADE